MILLEELLEKIRSKVDEAVGRIKSFKLICPRGHLKEEGVNELSLTEEGRKEGRRRGEEPRREGQRDQLQGQLSSSFCFLLLKERLC